ncbi:J domain-containing protein [Pedobacter sp. ASV12]|uniref:J domain-containing protein n=1 Tax=Pedobacter sp. ASV12 TaxID=2795120 RepID=UPI0018EC23F7|nr:DnaJ domain-containing protein [Pedobacter sp. ASV12]
MSDFKKDYYKILEISSSARADEIKLAYRKLVKQYHPDLHPGNTQFEDLMKEINEAYEVLGNKDERFAYDQYLVNKQAQQKKEQPAEKTASNHKRHYTKTTTVYSEERTYVKGQIFIKYFGKHVNQQAEDILRETFYKITVTQTDAIIESIYRQNLTPEFQAVFSANKPISLNISQPINCTVKDGPNNTSNYKLEILDLTIPKPEIVKVTKHEDESFGMVTGTFYGYVREFKSHEESTIVEECHGETGRYEEKIDNGIKYRRKEYYHANCSTYWGNWAFDLTAHGTSSSRTTAGSTGSYSRPHRRPFRSNSYQSNASGCLGSTGGIFALLTGALFSWLLLPKLAFFVSLIVLLLLLKLIPSRIWGWIARIASMLFALAYFGAIIATFRAGTGKRKEAPVEKPKTATIKNPRHTPVRSPDTSDKTIDTLIYHDIIWSDYNGKIYEGHFAIKKSALSRAHAYKDTLAVQANSEQSYDRVIYSLKENDKNSLSGLYTMFDSLKRASKPSQTEFAEIIVSFVQSIPYTLVLPKACDAQLYQDEFTASYLASADARCDGYERFGINTPVEFMASLNGDCDTRTLLLYTVLSHYGYDVALLSSSYYSHSVLGINLPYDGLTYEYNNQRYVLWETTVPNARPGILSNDVSNTNYWRISLKSK